LRNDQISKAAQLLLDARTNSYQLEQLPPDLRPSTIEDALAIQCKLFEMLGGSHVGWFLGGTNGSPTIPLPYAAPILSGSLHESGAVFRSSDFLTFDVDVEFGFTFGRNLPPRTQGYRKSEIFESIVSIHPTLDIVNSHFVNLDTVGWTSIVADNGTDGVVVRGPSTLFNKVSDLAFMEVKLFVNGRHTLSGTGSKIMGNPVNALCWFVCHMSNRGKLIREGDFLATGSCTEIYVAKVGDRVRADFGDIGSVEAIYNE
jgi:2-keto-4-pentenoate hydratase